MKKFGIYYNVNNPFQPISLQRIGSCTAKSKKDAKEQTIAALRGKDNSVILYGDANHRVSTKTKFHFIEEKVILR